MANSAPTAVNDSFDLRPDSGGFLTVAQLLANDTDPDGDALTLVSVGPGAILNDGYPEIVVFASPSATTTSFTYTVADPSGLTATATVSLRIGPFPLEPLAFTLAEDTRVVVATVNFSALGGQTAFDQPDHGTVAFELIDGGPRANIVYTPDPDYNGADGFTLTYSSSGGPTRTQGVNLTVTPVDEPNGGSYLRGTGAGELLDRSAATARVMIAALEGDDTLRGGGGNDALNGGAGSDVISGGAGNDLITGGRGADRMSGGAGADTFFFAADDLAVGGAADLIVDFQGAGQGGGDILRFGGFGAGATLTLVGSTARTHSYEVQDAAGASLGRLDISAGGTAGATLGSGDYVFV